MHPKSYTQNGSFLVLKVPFSICSSVSLSVLSQSWDLVQQTQNYLKLLISIINRDGEMLHPPGQGEGGVG